MSNLPPLLQTSFRVPRMSETDLVLISSVKKDGFRAMINPLWTINSFFFLYSSYDIGIVQPFPN